MLDKDPNPISIQNSRRGPGFWMPWAAVAVLAIVSVLLGVQNRALNQELDDETNLVRNLAGPASKAQQVVEVLTAPTAQRITLTEGSAPAEPTARATYLAERGGVILLATNLKPLPEDKTYELWVIPANGKAAVPAGLFRPDALGSATLVLPQLSAGIAAKALTVTVEKADGSDAPTLPFILSGATGS
jgi:anti-sigma-K factor RskA